MVPAPAGMVVPDSSLNVPAVLPTLPFSPAKQAAIFWYLSTDDLFFRICKDKVQPGWFANGLYAKLWSILRSASNELHRLPTPDELREHRLIQAEHEATHRNALKSALTVASQEAQRFGLDSLKLEMTEWMHATVYKDGMDKSFASFKAGDFSTSYRVMRERLEFIKEVNFDPVLEYDMADPIKNLAQNEAAYQMSATTGLSVLDAALSPNGTAETGGLFRGDLTVLMAASNVGKTTALITMAIANVLKGKRVLFITHEGRPSDIWEKMMQCILASPKHHLFDAYKTEKGRKVIEDGGKMLREGLIYLPYNRPGMCVEDVMPLIEKYDRDERSRTGRSFDLIVNDYPAKLSTHKADHGQMQRRNIDEVVYEQFVQLALSLNTHCLTAIQTNRAGSIANRDEERLLTKEDVLESWGVVTAATNVITLNRSDRDGAQRRLTYYVSKSRSSDVGRAVVCRTNYAAAISHSDELGATWYRGTGIEDPVELDRALIEHKNKAMPEKPKGD